MQQPGARRQKLDQTLRVAYGQGLLSDGTFVHRIDRLLRSPAMLEPRQLVGDLTLRRTNGPRERIRRLRSSLTSLSERHQVELLVLDWTAATTERLLIGRDPGCDIQLEHDTVSRRHAELLWRSGTWVLHDLNSTNGTTINGAPATRAQIRPGDLITFAGHALRVD